MPNVDDILSIAHEDLYKIAEYSDPQAFVNKCLGTEFTNCNEALRWYERREHVYDTPKRGDQIFVGNSTGIVELVTKFVIQTIEVDMDEDSVFYGLVCRKHHDIGVGIYCRPEYDEAELVHGPKSIKEIMEWMNDFYGTDDIVKAAQISIGAFPDGDFGVANIMSWKPVKRGHIGMHAQIVQAALICAGYPCGEYGANGYFGEDSVDAVKKFQKDNKMICSGIAGKAVATKLFKRVML